MASTHLEALDATVESVRLEAGQTIAVCRIAFDTVSKVIRREAARSRLQVNGFRRGAEPVGMLYRRHPRVLSPALIRALRSSKPAKLEELLKGAVIHPQYRTLPWDGSGDFHIEISFYRQPAAPNPNSLLGGAARPGQDASLHRPAVTGVQAPPLPSQGRSAASREHAVGPGLSLGNDAAHLAGLAATSMPELAASMPAVRSRLSLNPLSRVSGAAPAPRRPEPSSPENKTKTSAEIGPRKQAAAEVKSPTPVRIEEQKAEVK